MKHLSQLLPYCLRTVFRGINSILPGCVRTLAKRFLGAAKGHEIKTTKHCQGSASLATAEIRDGSRECDVGHQWQLLKCSPI